MFYLAPSFVGKLDSPLGYLRRYSDQDSGFGQAQEGRQEFQIAFLNSSIACCPVAVRRDHDDLCLDQQGAAIY